MDNDISPTTIKTNGDLKKNDWIWVRGWVKVQEDAEPCTDPRYVNVMVADGNVGLWVETMVRSRKRKVAGRRIVQG